MMTREEKIRTEAMICYPFGEDYDDDVQLDLRLSFVEGAKWADSHPISPWISVDDRLPEKYEEVLTDLGMVLSRDGVNWWKRDGYHPIKQSVKFWMHIPETPSDF